jgi:hypothetical protein
VADAVTIEPVSTAKFPANREKNREFSRIRPLSAILKADTRANLEACSEIPHATEQGIIFVEQGIPAQEQGILPAKTKSSSDEVFGTHRAFIIIIRSLHPDMKYPIWIVVEVMDLRDFDHPPFPPG